MTHPSLKAMAEAKSDGIQKATFFKVRPDVITFEPGFNLRDEGPALDAYIEQLYSTMKAGAYVPPIDVKVTDGKIVARDGHCRTRAALRLWLEGVEYLLEARQIRGNESDDVFHMLGSAAGRPFSPLEQGRGFLRLVRFGHEVSAIAARTGLHRSTIENGLALAEAPTAVQALVASGKVSSSLALKTVRKEGPKATAKLQEAVQAATAAGKTKATGKHVARPPGSRAGVPFGHFETGVQPRPPEETIHEITASALSDFERMKMLTRNVAALQIEGNFDRSSFAAVVEEARRLTQ